MGETTIRLEADPATGEIKGRTRQTSIAALASVERYAHYRVQVTVTSEVTVRCHDETEAAETGVADIDAGCGEVIKRQVAVTYIRPKD